MPRKAAFTFVIVAALAAAALPAFADEPREIYPQCSSCDPYNVRTDEPLVLVGWWGAATKGQVRVYFNHSEETLTLRRLVGDNEWSLVWSLDPDEMQDAYGPITPVASELWGLDCPMPMMYESMFLIPLELDEPGTYALEWVLRMDQPVNDGLHACTPIGWEGFPTPSLYRGEVADFVNTIIVTE